MKLNNIQENFINSKLEKLKYSKFRCSFVLKNHDKRYIEEKGFVTIEKHTLDFINTRLKNYPILNDGKQTPMKGHPVFIAQHATATCCRNCLNKWYKIPKNRELNEKEVRFIQAIIIEWIKRNN